jgi:hypothetical protein
MLNVGGISHHSLSFGTRLSIDPFSQVEDHYTGHTIMNGGTNKICRCHVMIEAGTPTQSCSAYGSSDCNLASVGEGRIAGADITQLDPSTKCYGWAINGYYKNAGSFKLAGNGLCQASPSKDTFSTYNHLKYDHDVSQGELAWTAYDCELDCIKFTRLQGVQDFLVGVNVDDDGSNVTSCYCWISNEEGSPGTATGPPTVCSAYGADSCSWSDQGTGVIAGILPSTEDVLNPSGGFARECWAYLQTPYYLGIQSSPLSLVGNGDCLDSLSNSTYNYINYDSTLEPWTVESCRDVCVKKFRYFDIENYLVGFQLFGGNPLQCRCLVGSNALAGNACSQYDSTSCSFVSNTQESGPAGAVQIPAGEQLDATFCYAWTPRDEYLLNHGTCVCVHTHTSAHSRVSRHGGRSL